MSRVAGCFLHLHWAWTHDGHRHRRPQHTRGERQLLGTMLEIQFPYFTFSLGIQNSIRCMVCVFLHCEVSLHNVRLYTCVRSPAWCWQGIIIAAPIYAATGSRWKAVGLASASVREGVGDMCTCCRLQVHSTEPRSSPMHMPSMVCLQWYVCTCLGFRVYGYGYVYTCLNVAVAGAV
jgi:hypothetical protein